MELEGHLAAVVGEILRVSVVVGTMNLPGSRQAPMLAKAGLVTFIATATYAAGGAARAADIASRGLFPVLFVSLLASAVASLAWNLILESYAIAFHTIGVQSGLSYASVIDPVTNVDNSILITIMQFTALSGFLGAGVHLHFFEMIASIESALQDISQANLSSAPVVLKALLKVAFEFGARIALPATAVLLILDTLSAVIGRLVDRFQMSAVLFPVKFIVLLLLMAISANSLIEAGLQKALELLSTLTRVT